jgi:hypothetical protein
MLCARCAPILLAAAAVLAAEPDGGRTTELRLGGGWSPAPQVHEEADGTSYAWEGGPEVMPTFQAWWLRTPARDSGLMPVWGGGFRYAQADLRPTSFVAGGTTVGNPPGQELMYRQLGLDLVLGAQYRFPTVEHQKLPQVTLEAVAFAGAAAVMAQTEFDVDGELVRSTGFGWAADVGIRAALLLTERNWTAGLFAGLSAGDGEARIRTPKTISTLSLDRDGALYGLELGYRF